MRRVFSAEVRKLNDMYKSCVRHCGSLSRRLEVFLLDKQKLMDHLKGLSAEKLLYSHAVHMVSSRQHWRIFSHPMLFCKQNPNGCVLSSFRCSLLLWMRCSTAARPQCSATIRLWC